LYFLALSGCNVVPHVMHFAIVILSPHR